jgi:hypothetical protein
MTIMKLKIAIAIIALSACVVLNGIAQTAGTTKKVKQQVDTQQAKDTYVCPMHADVKSDKAGKCTKCGMALEKCTTVAGAKHGQKQVEGKACEGKAKAGCEKECAKEGEAGCAGKH